jgi:hypothetical protein
LKSVDLSGATSIADIRRAVAARAATLPPGAWLTGSGWDEGKLANRRYVRASDPLPEPDVQVDTGRARLADCDAIPVRHIARILSDVIEEHTLNRRLPTCTRPIPGLVESLVLTTSGRPSRSALTPGAARN